MSYLLIPENDPKTFKSFLSGNEIEVGIVVSSRNAEFNQGKEVDIFYGAEDQNSYRAQIRKLISHDSRTPSGKSLLRMSLVKI